MSIGDFNLTAPGINPSCGAIMSECRAYRYLLWRLWDDKRATCAWIMLNPSTANEDTDDPTVRRCARFSKSWGYGGMNITNLFALRATSPDALRSHPDLLGHQ